MNNPIADPYSMNQHMQQLYDIVIEDAGYTEITGNYISEKFAELIVKECAQLAEAFVRAENNKLVEHVHICPWQLQDKIKEHFGVE
jgi:hypothetical protein